MRKLAFLVIALAAVVFVSADRAMAQDAPKVEVFGGYSYLSDDVGNGRISLNGFEASVTGNLNNWFGIEGNVAGHYGDHTHTSFMGGPKFTFRRNTVSPYVHALFGGDHISGGATRATLAVGGGLDAKINSNFSWRIVQVDYNPIFYDHAAQNIRVSTGIVFTF